MGEKRQNMTATVKTTPETRVGLARIINARVTYRNAPMHLLEKFTFKDIDKAHKLFIERAGFDECVILQTCNRVEIFGIARDAEEHRLLDEWVSAAGLSEKDLDSIEINTGKDAIEHLMRLASGLESLVIGEDQILGQVRRAFEFSRTHHYASANLSVVFDRALKAGSRIRIATGINKGNVSIASVAVNLAEEYFDDLKNKTVLLIGTGEAASLVAKVLKRRDVNFMIASRVPERAHAFADTVAGDPIAELVGKNMRSRIKEVNSAEKLINDEMKSFDTVIKRMKAEPIVIAVFKNVDTIRKRELKKAFTMIGKKMAPDEARVIEQLSYAIVEGVLSIPMNNLRKEIEEGGNEELMKIVAKLFKYEENQDQQRH